LFGNRPDLIKITRKHCGVWNIFGRFRELKEDNSSTNNEETHDDSDDRRDRSLETSKKDRRRDNRGAREKYVVCGRNQCSIEKI
jgi:hypothetical protein